MADELLGPITTNQDLINFDNLYGSTTRWESMKASAEIGGMGTATQYLKNFFGNKNIKDDVIKDPETLNRMFPDMDVPFSEPTGIKLANTIASRQFKKRELQALIQSAPTDGWQSALNFAATLAPHMVDPLEVITSAIGAGLLGAAIAPIAGLGGSSLLARAGISFAGGAAGNAVIEPWMMYGAHQDQEEYTVGDAATNIFAGALIGTTLHIGGKLSVDMYRKLKNGKIIDDIKVAAIQADQGKVIDTPKDISYTKKAEFRDKGLSIPREGVVKEGINLVKGNTDKYYMASGSDLPERVKGKASYSDGLFDDYHHLTNNSDEAATRIFNYSDGVGSIHEVVAKKVDNSNLKVLELDTPITKYNPEVDGKVISKVLQDIPRDTKAKSIKEMLDNLPVKSKSRVEKKIADTLMEAGYDGIRYKNKDNIETILFNDDSISHVASETVEKSNYETVSREGERVIKDLNDPTKNMYHDPEVDVQFSKVDPAFKDDFTSEVQTIIRDIEEKYRFPENSPEMKQINAIKEAMVLDKELVNDAYICLR